MSRLLHAHRNANASLSRRVAFPVPVETVREKSLHTVIDGVDEAQHFFDETKTVNRLIFLSHQVTPGANPLWRLFAHMLILQHPFFSRLRSGRVLGCQTRMAFSSPSCSLESGSSPPIMGGALSRRTFGATTRRFRRSTSRRSSQQSTVWPSMRQLPMHWSSPRLRQHMRLRCARCCPSLAPWHACQASVLLLTQASVCRYTPPQGLPVDKESYQRRAWCRAEQFCYGVANGAENLYLGTAPDNVRTLLLGCA